MATTRTTTPRKPAPTAHFSIATAEKEHSKGLDAIEPFTVALRGGDVIELVDPRTLGWQQSAALDISNPFQMVRALVGDDNYKVFVEDGDFPGEVLGDMLRQWREHYGVPQLGE